MIFRKFDHLLTTKPHDIHEVFISDLHLTEGSSLVDGFLALLNDLSALPNLEKLYILGDWFEVWIGDDAYLSLDEESTRNHWITPIINKLKQMRINGCRILVMVGNRDFLMRQPFCNTFAGELISEPYFTNINERTLRLEHGDALCTDDKAYQRFRNYTRKPLVQWWFLHKSLAKREKIASQLRNKSQQANSKKSSEIMDVNADAVHFAFTPALDNSHKKSFNPRKRKNNPLPPACEMLIHGHTHRPAIHDISDNKHRYVLGDWRIDNPASSYETVQAVIGAVSKDITDENSHDSFELFLFEWKK